MLTDLHWLALEAKYLDRARSFYESFLDLDVRREREGEVALAAGDTDLILRRPTSVPRGGVHTHYAFATPSAAYDGWWDRLSASFDLVEHQFGDAKSLYFYDVDGNCVEIGQRGEGGVDDGITRIFEVVFEVADLDRSEAFYRDLGMELLGRGDDRKRVRLTAGPFDFELWEPQLGLADGRGGVHVDVGLGVEDSAEAVETVGRRARSVAELDDGVRIEDPDGHQLTLRSA
ncbi:VOC family protein [Halorientalis pallida]|uniref:Fosmidomycin resistance protein n=1 Tax=Halorientalis pallida TaxID=2479928 RepID=A0A498KUY7_9EURY|nr:VOC family protein [Halorientalis pallida]RXK49088.1 fosmidomycin resistance protein [Halorientalis pallida]